MKHEKEIHPLQAHILKVLLFTPHARFSDLNSQDVSSDHFTFHVNKLVELNLIEKENNRYQLTTLGKEFANRFDADGKEMVLEKQAKIGVLIGCVQDEGKNKKYLIQKRLKQPYYGFYMFMTGKMKLGEKVEETAKRELEEETGLSAELKLVGVMHKADYDIKQNLLEDKYFFVFKGKNAQGNLINKFEGGENVWLMEEELFKLPDLIEGVDIALEMLNQDSFLFKELTYTVAKY